MRECLLQTGLDDLYANEKGSLTPNQDLIWIYSYVLWCIHKSYRWRMQTNHPGKNWLYYQDLVLIRSNGQCKWLQAYKKNQKYQLFFVVTGMYQGGWRSILAYWYWRLLTATFVGWYQVLCEMGRKKFGTFTEQIVLSCFLLIFLARDQ